MLPTTRAIKAATSVLPLALALIFSSAEAAGQNDAAGSRLDKQHANRDFCPVSCQEAGPTAFSWEHFGSYQHLSRCDKPQLFITDMLSSPDLSDKYAYYRACTSSSPSAAGINSFGPVCASGAKLRPSKADMQVVAWKDDKSASAASSAQDIATAAKELLNNLLADPTCEQSVVFGLAGDAVVGLYLGSEIRKSSAAPLVQRYIDSLPSLLGTNSRLGAQICGPKGRRSAPHVFGIVGGTKGDLPAIHATVGAWMQAECVTSGNIVQTWEEQKFSIIPATAMTDSIDTVSAPDNSTALPINGTTAHNPASTGTSPPPVTNGTFNTPVLLEARADCRAITVGGGDTCLPLAQRCGISTKDFYNYNGGGKDTFCNTLKVGSKVCCSSGTIPTPKPHGNGTCQYVQVGAGDGCWSLANTRCPDLLEQKDLLKYNNATSDKWCDNLKQGQPICCSPGKKPDLRPKKNADGSCASYTTGLGELCYMINDKFYLEEGDLDKFNKKKTWGWAGCSRLLPPQNICVSDGDPPMPAPMSGAICGPQKPGTAKPTNGTKIADLNPCPLNVCCNMWGQCGPTSEFCTDTTIDGTPGTAKNGTNGCISNCGTDIVKGDAPSSFSRVGYFEAFNGNRECLHMNVEQTTSPVIGASLTHIHFAFLDITESLQIDTSKVKDQWDRFVKMSGVKKIISFGGWAFSNEPATSHIFRKAVDPNNREAFVNTVAKFVTDNKLDGVDFDWEYPGATDILGSAPGNENDGTNYNKFLISMKAKLGSGKTVSIAAPASYWYLRNFPIKQMAKTVDYIIYMTYDLHGQWDVGSKWSSPGCANGNCLRSHINKTETETALSMITKAGVPSNKIFVGITSYGRSFKMKDPKCRGPTCQFLGERNQSPATKGVCTGEGGYIADAEIREIMALADAGALNYTYTTYFDKQADSDVIIYNGDQWVGWMDKPLKKKREDWYRGLNMGGTTDWAIDLQMYGGAVEALDPDDEQSKDLNYKKPELNICDWNKEYSSLDDLEKAAGGLTAECAAAAALKLLKKELNGAFDGYDEAAKGYDNRFEYYENYMKETLGARLVTFMREDGPATKFFKCYKKIGRNAERSGAADADCNDIKWPSYESWTYFFELQDKDGFEKALVAEGIDPEWVKMGTHTENRQATQPCGNFCYNDDLVHRGFPVKADKVEIPDPKDVVDKARKNFGKISSTYDEEIEFIKAGEWDGSSADVVESLLMPVTMIKDAIQSMIDVKAMGEEIKKEKEKDFILKIVEGILFLIPFVGGAIGRLGAMGARMARMLRGLEAFGDAAFLTYELIENPEMAPLAILSMLAGGKPSKKGYEDVAKAKRGMTSNQKKGMGPTYEKMNPKIESICSKSKNNGVCKVRRG